MVVLPTNRFLSTSVSTRGVPEKTFWDWLFTTGLAIGSVVTIVVLGIYAIYYYCGWQYYVDEYLERGWKAVNKCHWCSCGQGWCTRSRQISDEHSQATSSPPATASYQECSPLDDQASSSNSHAREEEADMSQAIAAVRSELIPFAEGRCGPDAFAFINDDKIIGDCISTSPYTSRRRSSSSLQFTPLSRKLFDDKRATPLGFRATPAATAINGVRGSIEIPARRISLDSLSPMSVEDSSFDNNIESEDSMSCAVRAIRLASLQFD
ncbi:hypothetical protein FOL47_004280 [Perkinsus chesapeaki]|uniref:Uncharacterized protein n=1 Tax=Perkinsus chesapeaki TaxID=330153 RepID=A0A7J6M3F9_PERCH|nr:hypothetical protein FOL47_004280 [Perkinsus chesapeaki]